MQKYRKPGGEIGKGEQGSPQKTRKGRGGEASQVISRKNPQKNQNHTNNKTTQRVEKEMNTGSGNNAGKFRGQNDSKNGQKARRRGR